MGFFWMQQWHPDKWTSTPSVLGEAKRKFQQIQEAYSGKYSILDILLNNDLGVKILLDMRCFFSSPPVSLTIFFGASCIYVVSEQYYQTRGKEQCTTQACMILMKRKTRWVSIRCCSFFILPPVGSIKGLIFMTNFPLYAFLNHRASPISCKKCYLSWPMSRER